MGRPGSSVIKPSPLSALVAACKAFLGAYEQASEEYYFGQMLDTAFCDVLEPMYAALSDAELWSPAHPSARDQAGTGE